MADLHVELVAADRNVWSGEANLVVARTMSGDIGIMANHEPLLGVLQSGPVTIRTSDGGTVVAAVHGGFISFADNKLSILAEIAELADEIDVDRAERALQRSKSESDAGAERRAEVRLAAAAGSPAPARPSGRPAAPAILVVNGAVTAQRAELRRRPVNVIVSVEAVGALLGVALVGLFVFGLRRRLIQRPGGTFDCSLRPAPPEGAEPGGKGWVYGVARYSGDRVEWFRVFSYAPRPRRVLERPAIEVMGRREPQGSEELALLSDAVVLSCVHRGARLELAMSDDALTGFLAWLEAAPPGQRVNVA